MDDEGTRISQCRIVCGSQPNLKVGERTVPAKYLNDKSKGETGDVKDFYSLILNSPEYTKKKKNDPEKVDHHNTVCNNFVKHLSKCPEIL